MPKLKLTEKQKRFCEEYLVDLNATQAALRAGYSEKTAYSIGDENLKKPEIQKYLRELMQERSQRTEVTADTVIRELKQIALAEDVEISGRDKIKALELLGKHLGMFQSSADNSEMLRKLDEVLGGIKSEF